MQLSVVTAPKELSYHFLLNVTQTVSPGCHPQLSPENSAMGNKSTHLSELVSFWFPVMRWN